MRKSTLALLFLGLFGLFGTFAHGYLENSDADATMHAARALYLRGDSGLSADGAEVSDAERVLAGYIETTGIYGMRGVNGRSYVWFPVGHLLLMVPCVAVGQWLADRFPEPERRLETHRGSVWGQFFWTRWLISFLGPAFAAGSAVVLFLLGRTLGLSVPLALLVMAASTLGTQFWPGATESLSDGPGMFFLLLSVLGVFRYHLGQGLVGRGPAGTLVLSGLAAGCAVLVRYPHAMLVAVLTASVLVSALRRRPVLHPLLFCAGGLPALAVLLAINHARYGAVLETGYSAAVGSWFGYAAWLGGLKILFAAGKGILWFSPVLWLALPQVLRVRGHTMVVAWAMFLLPLLLYSNTEGWPAGSCWSVRYLTPSVVLLVAVSLARGRPWERHPGRFRALCAAGLLVGLTGQVAPVRGHQEMAHEAARAVYQEPLARGDLADGNLPDHFFTVPRFSPIHGNWTYAWLALSGRLEVGGSANTTEPLFGVRVPDRDPPVRPSAFEDRGFRHLWHVYGRELLGGTSLLLSVLWLGLTAGFLGTALRRLLLQDPHAMGR